MRSPFPPSRSRRIAKWTGLVACVVILAMWAVSTRLVGIRTGTTTRIEFRQGRLEIVFRAPEYLLGEQPEWLIGDEPLDIKYGFELPDVSRSPNGLYIDLPFWFILTLVAIPTAILWHRDRRKVKPGCCRTCGYDLRASKKMCPECGTAIAPEPGRNLAMRRPHPPSRSRRFAKWIGLVACVVILTTWAVSTRVTLGYQYDDGAVGVLNDRAKRVFLYDGRARVIFFDDDWWVSVGMPLWIPLALAAIPTVILWHRDRRTVKPGCCRVCAYDLRASKKKCPECGTPHGLATPIKPPPA